MKLTFWTQFSSNHSANFTIVGRFGAPAEAEKGATEIRRILNDLSSWWQTQPEPDAYLLLYQMHQRHELTPVEEQLKTQYGLDDFQKSLDWVLGSHTAEIVKTFREWVIMDFGLFPYSGEIWSGPYPFEQILRALGSTVAGAAEERGRGLIANFQWTAPDEIIAERILNDFTVIRYVAMGGQREIVESVPEPYDKNSFYYIALPRIETHFDIYDGAFGRKGTQFWLRHFAIDDGEIPIEIILGTFLNYLEEMGCTNIQYDIMEDH